MWGDSKSKWLWTVSQCDYFTVWPFWLLLVFLKILHDTTKMEIFFSFEWGCWGAYLDLVGEHSTPVYLLFVAVCWSRLPRVFQHLMPLLFVFSNIFETAKYIFNAVIYSFHVCHASVSVNYIIIRPFPHDIFMFILCSTCIAISIE